MQKMKKGLWFCSDYGIEFESIIKKLNRNGEKYYVITHDTRKNWRNLSEESQDRAREAEKSGYKIYGIGFQGNLPGANVTNLHADRNEFGEKVSVLEQVNGIVGDRMTLDEQFIGAYAIGGTDEMKKVAGKLKLSTRDADAVIENVLFRNRRSLGIPLESEAEALRKIQSAENGKRTDYDILVSLDNILTKDEDEFVRN